MNDMHEVWDHAQLSARNRWVDVDTPAGAVKALLPPGVPASFDPRMDAVPAIGQHTDAILGELGYDSAAIAELRGESVI
jgi:itaconate CoA-transferase